MGSLKVPSNFGTQDTIRDWRENGQDNDCLQNYENTKGDWFPCSLFNGVSHPYWRRNGFLEYQVAILHR